MFKKTWTVAAIAASISSAYASEHIQPLFTALQPAEQQQAMVSTPLALTNPNEQLTNIDAFAREMFAFEDKVWLVSNFGVSVSERTEAGLVNRAKLTAKELNLNTNSNYRFQVSPNGKKVLILNTWQNTNDYTEISLDDNFNLTTKTGQLDTNSSNVQSINFNSDNSFKTISWSNTGYTAKYYTFGDNGVVYEGSSQENYSESTIFSQKAKTTFKKTFGYDFPNYSYSITVTATKLNPNGESTSTTVKFTDANNIDSSFVYDEVTNTLILAGYVDAYTLAYDAETNSFGNKTANSTTGLFGRNTSINGVISGDYKLIGSSSDYLKRTGSNFTYNTVSPNLGDYVDMGLVYNGKAQQLEMWTLSGAGKGLTQYIVKDGQLVKNLTQSRTELGFSSIFQNGYQLSSPDSPLLFVAYNDLIEVYKLNSSNQIIRLNAHSLESNYYNSNDKVLHIGNGFYVLISNSQTLKVLKETEENTLSLVQTLDLGKYLQYFYNGDYITSGNNIILKSDNEIALFNFDGSQVNFVSKIANQNTDFLKANERTELVKLDNKVYLLQPINKRYLEVSVASNLLSLKVAGKMPALSIGSVISSSDRLHVRGFYSGLITLMKNTEGDLIATAIDNSNIEMKFFKNRFAVKSNFISNMPNFSINDSVTGIWSDTIVSNCCDDNSRIYVSNNTLLAYSFMSSHKLTTYKINSAPFLPKVQPTLKLNQGVKQTQDLKAVVVDDEKDNLSFSGSLPAGFAVDNAGVLSFDGTTAGAGNYTVSVSDGGLATDLRLPYSINAAPALEKALPTVTVNEKQRLSLELSEFFSDNEGQAISFSATPVKGFTLSKAGLLAGVPADISSTELAFTATDSGSAVSAHKIVINVNAAPVWTNVASQSFTVGDTVKIELATAFSDREGNALTLQAANLPAGLTLTGNTISGAPTTSGEFKVSIQATDAGGAVGSGTMTITVNDKKSGGSTGPVSLALLAALAMLRLRKQAAKH